MFTYSGFTCGSRTAVIAAVEYVHRRDDNQNFSDHDGDCGGLLRRRVNRCSKLILPGTLNPNPNRCSKLILPGYTNMMNPSDSHVGGPCKIFPLDKRDNSSRWAN